MIRSSFQIARGIGPGTERKIWDKGLVSWEQFRQSPGRAGLSAKKTEGLLTAIRAAAGALEKKDSIALAEMLPPREVWRLWNEFKNDAVCLDIETTGLARDCEITVIGCRFRGEFRAFVLDRDINEFADILPECRMAVTFNGAMFDVPLIRNFLNVDIPLPNFDLRFLFRRLGFRGGLKKIENQLGLQRDEFISGVDGLEAVRLWHQHLRGDTDALNKLIEYNRADVDNLEVLADKACKMVIENEGLPQPGV